jgi:hypothetical protein
MALFNKTEEERAADDLRKKAEAARRAEAAFQASPQGKAAEAYARGDEFLQIEIPHSSVTGFTNAAFNSTTKGTIRRNLTRTDLLGQIEETGWHLEHANWVYIQTGQNSRDKFLASGQHVVVTGEVIGIYLFRRDDTRGGRVQPSKASSQGQPSAGAEPQKSTAGTPSAVSHAADTVKVKCYKCEHSQTVSASEQAFPCEQCGTGLKRRVQASQT